MSDSAVFVQQYKGIEDGFAINKREIQRYAGYFRSDIGFDEELDRILNEVIDEANEKISYKVCYRRFSLEWNDGMPKLPFECNSQKIANFLKGSSEVVLFAATVGLDIDRLIARYQKLSPVKALLLQAYGAERVECLCDKFCSEFKAKVALESMKCTARYSPGYGELPLDRQVDFFNLLEINRHIGISLNDSLLMTPSKSVTAFFGIGDCVGSEEKHKCSDCTKTDCEFRNVN